MLPEIKALHCIFIEFPISCITVLVMHRIFYKKGENGG